MGLPSSVLGATLLPGSSSSFPAAPPRSSSSCPLPAPHTPSDLLHSWDDPAHHGIHFFSSLCHSREFSQSHQLISIKCVLDIKGVWRIPDWLTFPWHQHIVSV